MKKLMILFALLAACTAAYAQNDYIEILRSDVRADKAAIIAANMELTEAESELYWPIYREYEFEATKLGDRKLALIKEYGEKYETLTDQEAAQIMKESFLIHEAEHRLVKKYFRKFSAALSAKRATRFLQIENRVSMLIELQIAAELPLVR